MREPRSGAGADSHSSRRSSDSWSWRCAVREFQDAPSAGPYIPERQVWLYLTLSW